MSEEPKMNARLKAMEDALANPRAHLSHGAGKEAREPRVRPCFYTRKGADFEVTLMRMANQTSDTPINSKAARFYGKINQREVLAYVRENRGNQFLDICTLPDQEGKQTRVAIANVRAGNGGIPKLIMNIGNEKVWVEVSHDVPDAELEKMGLDLARCLSKRKAVADAKAQKILCQISSDSMAAPATGADQE